MNNLDQGQLNKLLTFKNEDVISRFMDMFEMGEGEVRDIFQETLKFLYISQVPGVFIPDDLLIIDEMWHNLILFTPQYHEFSKTYFNTPYFHHLPASKEDKEQRKYAVMENPGKAREEYLKKMEFLMSVTYDYLGADTVEKWFVVFPKKYSKANIKKMKRT